MENNKTGYFIYDFERGQFWNQNQMGYTPNLKEAGRFDFEDAFEIVKNSNITKIESEMIHCTQLERLFSIKDEIGVKDKPSMDKVLEKYTENNKYFKNNPFGEMIKDLEDAGYYFKPINIPHADYERNTKIEIEPEFGNEGLRVNLYRMPSGNYEVTINKIDMRFSHEKLLIKEKNKNKNKM